jgi:hypothetical protein
MRGKLTRTKLACQAGFPLNIFCRYRLRKFGHRELFLMARELRTQIRTECMATKIKMMKLLTESDAAAEIDRVPPKPALFLMQRARAFQPALPKRRLPIRIYPGEHDQPAPVQIIFLKPDQQA